MLAYQVNTIRRCIALVTPAGIADLQRLVGGYIELAHVWPSGDTLFVDEEGRLKPPPLVWFMLHGCREPFCGNGVVVGREVEDDNGCRNERPVITPAELRGLITWLT